MARTHEREKTRTAAPADRLWVRRFVRNLAIAIEPYQSPGRVAVFTGPFTPGTRTESDASVVWLLAPTPPANPRGGMMTISAGDVDGDTVADLVIGNGPDEVGGPDAGAVFLLPHAGL